MANPEKDRIGEYYVYDEDLTTPFASALTFGGLVSVNFVIVVEYY